MGLKDAIESLNNSEDSGLIFLQQDDIDSIHSVMLEMLTDFDTICQRLNINWFLAGGSMLGAVRHHGFIPWDDDADIHIFRSDYEKLVEYFRNTGSEKYELGVPGEENYLYHHPKLFNKGTVFKEVQSCEGCSDAFFIDIFLLEDTYDSAIRRFFHGLRCTYLLAAVSTMRTYQCRENLLKYSAGQQKVQKEVKLRCRLSLLFRYRSLAGWLKKADKCFSKVNNPGSALICVPSGAGHYFGELYERNLFGSSERTQFEDTYLPIPSGARDVLALRYGADYMIPPSEDRRLKHALISFRL